MLSSTVFTVCLLTAITLFLEASPVQGKYFTGYDLFQRAAVKAARVFVHGRSDHLRSRQQTYAPGDPVYQAEVVSWVCDSIAADLQAQCVIDVNAAIENSTVPYCAQRSNELTICLVDPPAPPENCSDSQVSFDNCANTTIATYDYCIGLGYTTLPDLPNCADSELQLTPNPNNTVSSSPTTTSDWYGSTDSSAPTTTDTGTYLPPSSTSGRVTPVPVVSSTTSGSASSDTRTAVTSTILTTYPIIYTTTTTCLGSTTAVTISTTGVSTILSCAGGCTAPTPASSGVCVRRQRIRPLRRDEIPAGPLKV